VRASTAWAGSARAPRDVADELGHGDAVGGAVVGREQSGPGLRAEPALAGPEHERAEAEGVEAADREVAERSEPRGRQRPRHALAGRDREGTGVEDQQLVDAVDVLDGPGERDGPAPVVHHERDRLGQAQAVDELGEVGHPPAQGVRVVPSGRLLRPPHADVVRRDRPQAQRRQGREQRPVVERPGRVAVHEQHGRPGALVDVGHPVAADQGAAGGDRPAVELRR
jgi:hypothetical protein